MSVSKLGGILGVVVVLAFAGAACSSSSPAPAATFVRPTVTPPTATVTPTTEPTPTTTSPLPTQVPSPVPSTPPPTTPTPTATALPAIPIQVILIEANATLGGCDFRLEVADTATERSRGLMERESLPLDQGMLFVFGFEQELNFWMKNTLIRLDIVYLNDALQVVDVQTMIPEHEILPDLLPIYTSAAPAKFALEVNAGVADQCGITPGVTMGLTYLN